MTDVTASLADVVGTRNLLGPGDIPIAYTRDESLTTAPRMPSYVVRPATTAEVSGVLRVASAHRLAVTARGMGTGLAGACVPQAGGLVVSFERMNAVLDIDSGNHVAVVQPGVTLAELDKHTASAGLVYPVHPGESSASIGGTIGTNAGGMHAVKYGVTRHHVLGLEAVLPSGEVIRTGGRYVKTSSGYDLTQLIIGSEGTLALVTEAILKLRPRSVHQATMLAPFATLGDVASAVPAIVAGGLDPLILEYLDMLAMASITADGDLALGIPERVRREALAYLVVIVENNSAERLEADLEALGEMLTRLGADDVYLLPAATGRRLIEAREKAFWSAKAAGADDIIDIVVPRTALPEFLAQVSESAQHDGAIVAGCGHAGDGNVHLSVFQPEPASRARLLRRLYQAGITLGGTVSGEHGIGTAKKQHFLQLEDPVKVDLMRRIKKAFDPDGLLNPGVIFDADRPPSHTPPPAGGKAGRQS